MPRFCYFSSRRDDLVRNSVRHLLHTRTGCAGSTPAHTRKRQVTLATETIGATHLLVLCDVCPRQLRGAPLQHGTRDTQHGEHTRSFTLQTMSRYIPTERPSQCHQHTYHADVPVALLTQPLRPDHDEKLGMAKAAMGRATLWRH